MSMKHGSRSSRTAWIHRGRHPRPARIGVYLALLAVLMLCPLSNVSGAEPDAPTSESADKSKRGGLIRLTNPDKEHLAFIMMAGDGYPMDVDFYEGDCIFFPLPRKPELFDSPLFSMLVEHKDALQHRYKMKNDGKVMSFEITGALDREIFVTIGEDDWGDWGIREGRKRKRLGLANRLAKRTPGELSQSAVIDDSSTQQGSAPLDPGDLRSHAGNVELAIFYLPKAKADPGQVFRRLLKQKYPRFRLAESIAAGVPRDPYVVIRKIDDPLRDYAPPDLRSIPEVTRGHFAKGVSARQLSTLR